MQRSSLILVPTFAFVCGCSSSEGASAPQDPSGGGSAGTTATAGSGGLSTQAGSSSVAGGGAAAVAGSGGVGGGGAAGAGGSGGANGGMSGSAGGGAGGAAGAGGQGPVAPDVAFCKTALDAAAVQLAGFRGAYTNPASVPRSAKAGKVSSVGVGDWTSGFVGGSYWLLYEHTKDQAFRSAAEASTAALDAQKTNGGSHDLGFQFMCTYGNGYRLTQNESYLGVLKTAAATLATRFRDKVSAIESWDAAQWDCPVIIDNMMNLHLLYTVSEKGGSASYAELATRHAETTRKNHFRADNSSFHLVNYNSGTGAIIGKQTVQGFANDSAWARGQSWGLYGFTESSVSAKNADFLAQAQKIADYLIAQPNMPADKVPYWDYDAFEDQGTATPRDASAGAIMASALLQLSGLSTEPKATQYRDFALSTLESLSSAAYAAKAGENSHFLLMHSTGHLPDNSEIDVALNYADYYYLEALLRCQALAK